MDTITQTVIFIVGLGAPEDLYVDYLGDLKTTLPHAKFLVLEWWNQDDFGMTTLQSYIGNSDVILIAHSAGSVIALQALEKWPAFIKKIIMLDSHFLRSHHVLPTIERMLEIMLTKDNSTIQNRVKDAYAPMLVNDAIFKNALQFAINWVNEHFDQACNLFDTMPAHAALFIGFTNSSYQILNSEEQNTLSALWQKHNVDVKFFPINHFDLIEENNAKRINQCIVNWLSG